MFVFARHKKQVFSHRTLPEDVIDNHSRPNDDLYNDTIIFNGLLVDDVEWSLLNTHYDCLWGFSKEAFCYYLQAIVCLSIKYNDFNSMIVSSFVNFLDTSQNPNYWHDFFLERMTLLTTDELSVLQDWILIIEENSIDYDAITIERCFLTLERLIQMKK